MFKYLLTYLCVGLSFKSYAQINLVPNSGFDEYANCEYTGGTAQGIRYYYNTWIPNGPYSFSMFQSNNSDYLAGLGSPDVFCPCYDDVFEPSGYTVPYFKSPKNAFGFSYARSDSCYGGLGIYGKSFNVGAQIFTERFRTKLIEPLKAGYAYKMGLYWSLSDSSTPCNKLAMVASVDSFWIDGISGPFVDINKYPKPQVEANEILSDTSDWNLLENIFIAKGGEIWLTIGKFVANEEINFSVASNAFKNELTCYFYIDDVFLYEYPEAGVPESEIQIPNIFTPNGDGINDLFELTPYLPPGTQVTIYNRWGNEVFQHDNYQNNWDGNTKFGQKASPGVYFYIIKFPQGLVKKGTITIVYE